jgi:SAM-dependent methyltransferase
MSIGGRLKYLGWAAARILNSSRSCPACGEGRTELIRRKYLVTALYRCSACELLFRVPKPDPDESEEFYQGDYSQGFTTECPTPRRLAKLMRSRFRGTEKDYAGYIAIVRAAGVKPPGSILDFGCSWGYGSWQMSQEGYRVYSTEISRPRARYAQEKLGCRLCDPGNLPEKMDCVFSAHVIEHLCNPRTLWEVARTVLKPSGVLILFCPNGEPSRDVPGSQYHLWWGEVHPLYLTAAAMRHMGEDFGFRTRFYSTPPYDADAVARGVGGDLSGDELLTIARYSA